MFFALMSRRDQPQSGEAPATPHANPPAAVKEGV
jgi:hypothetical protein